MKPRRIAIIEDEVFVADGIKSDLLKLGYTVVEPVADTYEKAIALLAATKPDLVLVDIRLRGDKTGIDVARHINAHQPMPFVFVTSHLDAGVIGSVKEVNPTGFLTKPYFKENLFATIELAFHNHSRSNRQGMLTVKDIHGSRKIPLEDIRYIEADNMYVKIVLATETIVLRKTLKEILDEVPHDQFAQVHRSFAVNLGKVLSFKSTKIVMEGGEVPVGREYVKEITEVFARA